MIAVDTNVLVYAHRPEYRFHEPAGAVVSALSRGGGRWAIPWPCLHEFYAVVTNARIHPDPSSPAQAWRQIDIWLTSPGLTVLAEAHTHAVRLRELTLDQGVVGGKVHDARIAAICLSHGVAELITMDRDFSRFPRLRTRSLLA